MIYFDILNHVFLLFFKISICIGVIHYIVCREIHFSADLRHWLLFNGLLAAGVMVVGQVLLPSLNVGVLPICLSFLQSTIIFDLSSGVFSFPNAISYAVMAVYFFGLMLGLQNILKDFFYAQSIVSNAYPVEVESVVRQVEKIKRNLDIHQNVMISHSARVNVPIIWGYFRPVIVLPDNFICWRRERLERVLTHEMTHLRRADWVFRQVVRGLCPVIWFFPGLRGMVSNLFCQAELACDDQVVNTFCELAYVEDLMELSSEADDELSAAPALVQHSHVFERIEHNLLANKDRSFLGFLTKGAVSVLFILAAMGFSTLRVGCYEAPYAEALHKVTDYSSEIISD